MAIVSTPTDVHWNYFLSIEADLIQLSRFIEFHDLNLDCFSLENVRILMAASAEVDVVCKQICQRLNPNSNADNIHQYRDAIASQYPNLLDFSVSLPRYGKQFTPWINWKNPQGVPDWWTAYNKVKHERHTDFQKANLGNVLNAVAGLCVICLYLYEDKAKEGKLHPFPTLFVPAHDHIADTLITFNGWQCKL
jgi:hypothetical protein